MDGFQKFAKIHKNQANWHDQIYFCCFFLGKEKDKPYFSIKLLTSLNKVSNKINCIIFKKI